MLKFLSAMHFQADGNKTPRLSEKKTLPNDFEPTFVRHNYVKKDKKSKQKKKENPPTYFRFCCHILIGHEFKTSCLHHSALCEMTTSSSHLTC